MIINRGKLREKPAAETFHPLESYRDSTRVPVVRSQHLATRIIARSDGSSYNPYIHKTLSVYRSDQLRNGEIMLIRGMSHLPL
jgi:hypothetical protein